MPELCYFAHVLLAWGALYGAKKARGTTFVPFYSTKKENVSENRSKVARPQHSVAMVWLGLAPAISCSLQRFVAYEASWKPSLALVSAWCGSATVPLWLQLPIRKSRYTLHISTH